MLGIAGLGYVTAPFFGGEDPLSGPWHHADITRAGAAGPRGAGWTKSSAATGTGWRREPNDRSATDALAWHADYIDSYLYNPLWWAAGGEPRFKAALRIRRALTNLHFDDLGSTRQIQLAWRRYLSGTVAGLLWAADAGDVAAARNVVGVGLHAIQDFYSHSNWVDDPARRDKTWEELAPDPPDGPDPRDAMHLHTGAYESPGTAAFKPHGTYAFDCSLMAKLPAPLMELACTSPSPFAQTAFCRRWEECKGSAPAGVESIAGVTIPPHLVYLEPPGIAIDTTWMAAVALKQRDIPDRAALTADQLFGFAKELATRHTTSWLRTLDDVMTAAGHAPFWKAVKTQPRATPRWLPGPPELKNMLGAYRGDLQQYEEGWRVPFAFLSAGRYPPDPGGRDEGWFLRLQLETAQESGAGTDADVVAVVDGSEHLLDHGPELGRGAPNRLLEYNDFEAGDRDTYVIGPFAARPRRLELHNRAASGRDVMRSAWEGFVSALETIADAVRVQLLSLIGGNADLVGTAHATWSWEQLEQIADGGGEMPFTTTVDGADEGRFEATWGIRASRDAHGGLAVRFSAEKLKAVRESTADAGSDSDEPFVVLQITSPASAQVHSQTIGPLADVDAGETHALSMADAGVTVPRYGGVVFAHQVWESDAESAADRERIRAGFVRGYEERAAAEREDVLDVAGRALAAKWKVGRLDAYAFRRGTSVEVARLVENRPIDRWIDGGGALEVPLEGNPRTRLLPVVPRTVRHGSIVKVGHYVTGTRLHSHPLHYGHPGGSGQQQVTAYASADDNDLWLVKARHGTAHNARGGEPVEDRDVIRLEHVLTRRNLHSHPGFPSPVTAQGEATCFGSGGTGDANDDWRVEVDGGGAWAGRKRVRLVHVLTGRRLHSHGGHAHPEWTAGQQEVTAYGGRDENDLWLLADVAPRGAQFVGQSVPRVMRAGARHAVSVTMRNVGGEPWTREGAHRLGAQSPHDTMKWGLNRVDVPGPVAAGQPVTFAFRVTAPAKPGTHAFQWAMLQEMVEWFGEWSPVVTVSVVAA